MAIKKQGPGITKERLKALPGAPGIYLMKDESGAVIYVGKAKDLRSRVRSYFSGGDERYNVQFILDVIASIETLVTEDERQALVLESDLIKKYKPVYNVRLKDDKAHLVVRIDMNHEWPRLELVRRINDDGARYIGPFVFSSELRTMLEVLKRIAPLRTCSDRIIYNRVRPCLEYQIKRCAAPCCLTVDRAQYLEWIEQAVQVLQGHTEEVVVQLEHEMERASRELRYEDAAVIRDRIQVLQRIREENTGADYGSEAIDAFGLYREGDKLEFSVLSVRLGKLFESKTFGFTEVQVPDVELLPSLLTQFYEGETTFPAKILLPFELDDSAAREDWFSERAGRKVEIVFPRRGAKMRLLDLAQANAKQNFEARFSDLERSDRILQALKSELQLEEMPRTIECVDISHFQGGATVGAVVVFQDMRPDKTRYRSFHLSRQVNDDFGSMREVVGRYLSRAAEENTLSDLMIIDGGPAQLAQAAAVKRELGLTRPAMIGLAKKKNVAVHYRAAKAVYERPAAYQKPERIYLESAAEPVVLNPRSEALHLLERVRNEAHRFAIAFHRKTRTKTILRSALDDIPGIGPGRRKLLLSEFGSVEAIREAEPEELSVRCRIPVALARKIVAGLRRQRIKSGQSTEDAEGVD